MAIGVEVIETASLGDRSYLATDGSVAVVVDPQRDVDRVLALAGQLDVRIALVLETHVHNDYISGGLELARLTGADYGLSAADRVPFAHRGLVDGEVIDLTRELTIRVVATPGHTFNHLSYVLESDQEPTGVFTGGSLLYGSTGRTDLLGEHLSEELARHQYASVQHLASLVPDRALIWPTHGFGSFCSAGPVSAETATMGDQKAANPVLTLGEQDFIAQALSSLDAYPAYYAHMGVRNAAGPEPVDLRLPARTTPEDLARRLAGGEWVVDLRSRAAFARSHLTGIVSLGLDGPMATWLGWLAKWQAPITLVGQTIDDVQQAQRELARIGIGTASTAVGGPRELAREPGQLTTLPEATFAQLAKSLAGQEKQLPAADVVVDVRSHNEWRSAHVRGALHVPLHELGGRVGDIGPGSVWVHCGSGYRAAAAASLLERAGRDTVLVDDEFSNAAAASVPLTSGD